MREYAKVVPKMWHGKTMKALRKNPEALIVAMYLITSPSSNMLGLFAQPVMYMAYETGLGIEGASKGLQHCVEAGFCSYDDESEFVFVHEMASYQIAPELSPKDKQCVGIQKAYDALPDNPFLGSWYDRYAAAFHLTNKRESDSVEQGAYQAPSKAHRSQEQEQEQEQEKDPSSLRSEGARADAPPPPPAPAKRSKREESTLANFLATCRKQHVKPVPDDHSIRTWATDAGITDEMLQIAWVAFKERYTEDPKYRGKRYKDWAATFANSVKDSWFGLWFASEAGGVQWSSKGLQRKQVLDARQAQRQQQEGGNASA
ncbi:hypothetical protein LJR074_002162 [Acidovorax sp. LjRoot74]|uniref:hypothetical protein n=1 Tax=Acidovorax sp. LjRoot74 TaxID=3342337 RepID=UPI003ED0B89C